MPCKSGYFRCQNGRCIQEHKKCDDMNDCLDNSDERPILCYDGNGKGCYRPPTKLREGSVFRGFLFCPCREGGGGGKDMGSSIPTITSTGTLHLVMITETCTVGKRAVRILLEWFLVEFIITSTTKYWYYYLCTAKYFTDEWYITLVVIGVLLFLVVLCSVITTKYRRVRRDNRQNTSSSSGRGNDTGTVCFIQWSRPAP